MSHLTVRPRDRGADFCRGRFGPATWPDLDRNGCSTRQDVLRRSATTMTTARIRSHGATCDEVVSGTWVDAYTGASLTFTDLKDPTQAQRLQIDHLVSLFDAWVSGARTWPAARRVAFAQDLATHELYAVSGQGNFDKAYRGVDSWQPAPARRCDVARSVVQVKSVWALSVTASERRALTTMLATCR